ncbi:MAG: hypothetical protein IKD33_04325, partial [Bacteroidales bacterium]|nr:hypothetical protein [Bacteroidales bacterium]
LNWGYKFIPIPGNWFVGFNRESTFETGGLNYNGNDLFNICQFSVGGGFGMNYSHNETEKMLMDINGDGLPDRVQKNDNTNSIDVEYNVGYGVWGEKMPMGIPDIIQSYSLSGSTNISGTIGFTLWGLKMTGTLSGSAFNPSCNIDKVQIADFNNDGLPDFVTSDTKGVITVCYNQLGGVNLLTKVTNPMGGTIEIGYSLTESSIKNPNRMWVMDSVTIDAQSSPVGGSIMKTSYEYSTPYYDRYERTSYGFEKVTTRQYKSNNTLYRYTEECYNNSNYALKGKKKSEALFDGSGKKYTETLYDMAILDPESDTNTINACSKWVAPVITAEIHNFYEGKTTAQLTTMISYEYDNYRNIIYYRNWGDTADSTDDAIVDITYYTNRPKNMVGLKSGFTVNKAGSGNTLMRKYDFNYDTSGNLTRERIYKDSTSVEAVYTMEYDTYGNVITFIKPADENGNRPQYRYTYDTYTYTYPTAITDTFGLTSTATYDYRFGVPLKKTDPSGDSVVYTYDYRGRTKTITGPKELAANKPYTIRMEYYPTKGIGQGKYFHGWNTPFAHTFHYDVEHPNDEIQTTVFCDKIGRVIQTKKDGVVNGASKTLVSGKIELDEFGRTIKQYLPFAEPIGNDSTYTNDTVGTPTTTEYDVMDRQTKVVYPVNAIFTTSYDVASDYSGVRKFRTKTIDPLNRITYTYTDYAGKTTQITDALNGNTKMEYDCLHQLTKTTDPEGYSTTYSYDNLGRMTSRVHPDEGTTTFTYNPAGQVTRKTNANNDYITYKYNRNRLTQIQYSKHPENNVTYTYGTTGNGKGRITKVENGSMIKLIEYGNMGEVVAETKTFAIPNTGKVYTFKMNFEYDSWNRMQKITYPDGEIVQYTYDQGGNLLSMSGTKNNSTTNYITKIHYNEQEKRSYIEYGNGVKTRYKYDSRMRLDSLVCMYNTTTALQKIKYTYDNVDNITRVVNSGGTVNTLGGSYVYTHTYDVLNRLIASSGTYKNANSYSL